MKRRNSKTEARINRQLAILGITRFEAGFLVPRRIVQEIEAGFRRAGFKIPRSKVTARVTTRHGLLVYLGLAKKLGLLHTNNHTDRGQI